MLNKNSDLNYTSGKYGTYNLDGFISYNNDVKKITAGYGTIYILKNDGTLWSCGNNANGALGLGDTTNRSLLTQIVDENVTNIRDVYARTYCVFIIKNDGTLWACGKNNYGQLGIGSTTNAKVFTQCKISTGDYITNVKQISCGGDDTYVLLEDGTVWVCGYNYYGELNLNSTTQQNSFIQSTTNISDVKKIECGGQSAYMLKNDGTLWACGRNAYGEMGRGDSNTYKTFVQITANINNDVRDVIAGAGHAVILKNDGSIWGAGRADYGQYGYNTTNQTKFVQITNNINNDVKEVYCHGQYTCILKTDNSLWVVGYNNVGQLGLGNKTNQSKFVKIESDVSKVIQGYQALYVLKRNGVLLATGDNSTGALMFGHMNASTCRLTAHDFSNVDVIHFKNDNEPYVLKNDGKFYDRHGCCRGKIACGGYHTALLKDDGSLWMCGRNNNGQLGLGDTTDRTTFVKVTNNINYDVKDVACGLYHTMIIKTDGSIWGVGLNGNGQLGIGNTTNQTKFVKVTSNITNDAEEIYCGGYFTFAKRTDGRLASCGRSTEGQLAINSSSSAVNTFTNVTSNVVAGTIKQIACGMHHVHMLRNDGTLWACGHNGEGQLGLNNTSTYYTFTKVSKNVTDDVEFIDSGERSTFIIKKDGTLWSTGQNDKGQLGLADTSNKNYFIQVTANVGNNIIKVSSFGKHTIIVKDDGSIWGTGQNDSGQLGLGDDLTNKNMFTKISDGIENMENIICGQDHTLITKIDGTFSIVGDNLYGQLNLGHKNDISTITDDKTMNIHVTNLDYKPFKKDITGRYFVEFVDKSYIRTEKPMKACDVGAYHALFIDNNNQLISYCKSNEYFQAGENVRVDKFYEISEFPNVKMIACGDYSSYVYTHDEELYVFGYNSNGQLGLGGTETAMTPTLIHTVTGVKKMYAIGATCFILLHDGSLLAVGENSQGEFGLDDYDDRNLFTKIASNVKDFWYKDRSLVYYANNILYATGSNSCNKFCVGSDVTTILIPTVLFETPSLKALGLGTNNVMIITGSESKPVINFISKSIPNFDFSLQDEDLVSCDFYLNDVLIKSITEDLSTQVQRVKIPEESVLDGRNHIKIIVKDAENNIGTTIVKFDKNPVSSSLTIGSSIVYKGEKYTIVDIIVNENSVSLKLDRRISITVNEGDRIRAFEDNIEVKCECDGSGNDIPMKLVNVVKTDRDTIKETYELDIECRTFAPNIILNKSTGLTKISRVSVSCTEKGEEK